MPKRQKLDDQTTRKFFLEGVVGQGEGVVAIVAWLFGEQS